MLNYDELNKISEFKKLSIRNAEKDYLQESILFILYDKLIGKELVFKGGTCLYKIYKLNRFSEDLDFTQSKKINLEKVIEKLRYNLKLLGILSRLKEIQNYRNEKNVRLLLHGPLYKGKLNEECFISFNISLRERVLSEPKHDTIISMYKDIPSFSIFSMDEREIVAEKVRAIYTRESPRDVYDLWFLIVQKNVSFDLKSVNKKLKIYKIKFNFDEFRKKLEMKRRLWKTDLDGLVFGILPDFEIVSNDIISKLSVNE